MEAQDHGERRADAAPLAGRRILVLGVGALPDPLRSALAGAWDEDTAGLLGRLAADAPFDDSVPWQSRHTIDGSDNPSRARRAGAKVLDRAGVGDTLARRVRGDRWLHRAARGSDLLVLALAPSEAADLGPVLAELAPETHQVDAVRAAAALHAASAAAPLWALLEDLDPGSETPEVEPLLAALQAAAGPALPWTDAAASRERLRPVLGVAHELARYGRHDELEALHDAVGALPGIGPDDLVALGLTALERSTRISRNATPLSAVQPPDMIDVARRTLEAADAALEAGTIGFATDMAAAALRLVYNRDLHADVPQTPLVDEPHVFLEPLTHTRIWRLLTSAQPRRPAPQREEGARNDDHDETVRVLVLPGAYPHFATPLIAALEAHPATDVTVTHLPMRHRYFSWVGINRHALGMRLRHALGSTDVLSPRSLADIDDADVIVADWADRGAMWASLMVPEGTRLVVRVHSMDSLSPWLQLIDWTKVDGAVFVSTPILDLSADALTGRLPEASRVIGNGIRLDRFANRGEPREPRTLGMVGWSRPVKDPLFALAVLRRLLERDPDGGWRLRLVGPDLQYSSVEQINAYRRTFHEELTAADLVDHVDFVDQTPRVEEYVRRFGFILSTSVRESFHAAVVEGVAAGAVPIVRNWPILARRDGAAQIYPREWIVEDVDEAVERIWALREPADRDTAAARAMGVAAERFSFEDFTSAMHEAVVEPVLRARSGATEAPASQPGEHLDRGGDVAGR